MVNLLNCDITGSEFKPQSHFNVHFEIISLEKNLISVHNLPRLRTSNVYGANEIKRLYTKKVNTPTQTESLPHSLEQAADGIGLHVNVDKTEFMCFYK